MNIDGHDVNSNYNLPKKKKIEDLHKQISVKFFFKIKQNN